MQIGRTGRPNGRLDIVIGRTILPLVPIVRAALLGKEIPISVGCVPLINALVPAMSKPRTTRRPSTGKRPVQRKGGGESENEPAADAITIAWTASVSAVLLADLATIAAHFFSRSHPDAKTAPVFAAIMLLTACLMGIASLMLLVVVWRVRRLKPPQGFLVFATIVAVAPILATIVRLTTP